MTAAVAALLFIFAILSVLVQTTGGTLNIVISYSAVMLACLSNLLFFENKPRFWLMQIALICTVCADWFLLVAGEGYEIGMWQLIPNSWINVQSNIVVCEVKV